MTNWPLTESIGDVRKRRSDCTLPKSAKFLHVA